MRLISQATVLKRTATIGVSIGIVILFFKSILSIVNNPENPSHLSNWVNKNSSSNRSELLMDSIRTFAVFENSLGKFLIGRLVYGIPDTMYLGSSARVALSISTTYADSLLLESIRERTKLNKSNSRLSTRIREIAIGKRMKVTLKEPRMASSQKFEINLITGNEEQAIEFNEYSFTQWEWEVTPLEEGEFPLIFSVEIILLDEIGKTSKSYGVLDETVLVRSSSKQRGLATILMWGFIIFVGLPVISLLLFKFILKKKKKKKQRFSDIEVDLAFKKFKNLIGNGKIEEAIVLFLNDYKGIDKKFDNAILAQQSKLSMIRQQSYQGTEDPRILEVEKNKIIYALLQIVDEMSDFIQRR